MSNDASFGRWLKQRRKALDLTQDELARQVACSMKTIYKIEAGERRPSRQIAERLLDVLDVPSEERAALINMARMDLAAALLEAPADEAVAQAGALEETLAQADLPAPQALVAPSAAPMVGAPAPSRGLARVVEQLRARWRLLLPLALLELALASIYLRWNDLYLFGLWRWLWLALALALALWSVARLASRPGGNALVLTLVSVALLIIAGLSFWRQARPTPFAPEQFGVLVAELGEGAGFERTSHARELSGRILAHLCDTLVKRERDSAVCQPDEPGGQVRLRSVGVIPNAQTALQLGSALDADMVIWGQLLTSSADGALVQISLPQPPELGVNPSYPLLVPVTMHPEELFASAISLEGSGQKIQEVVVSRAAGMLSFALGLTALGRRDYPGAVLEFERALATLAERDQLTMTPHSEALLWFYLGRAYSGMANNQLDKAVKALERARELNPQEPAVEMAFALIYGSLGQEAQLNAALDRALALLQDWLPMHLHDALAYYNRGLIYQITKRYEDARLDFQQALQENPNLLIAYMSLAQVEGELGHFSQASDTLWRGIKLAEASGSNPAWAYMNLAIIEEKAQEFSRARAAYQRAVELAPQDPWMFHYYAAFLESRQELDAALLAYQSLAQVAQDRAWGYSQLADFYKKRGMLEEMAGAYRQAVHEDPDNGEIYYLLAVTYLELGQPDQALLSFDQAASLGQLAPERYGDYANLLYSIGSYERAIELYQRVLEQTPDSWPALTNMAQAQLALGACQKAVALYTSVLERPQLFADEQRAVAQNELERLNTCK